MIPARIPADEDRLPWLEPFRESEPRPARAKQNLRLALFITLLVAALAAAVFWFLDDRLSAPVDQPLPDSARSVRVELGDTSRVLTVDDMPVEQPLTPTAPLSPTIAPPPEQIESEPQAENATERIVKPKVEPKPKIEWPPPPKAGPSGQVIQLGAFDSPRQADDAWEGLIARFPNFAKLPKVVVPTPPRKGRPRFYRLQLGTPSPAQSIALCDFIRGSGRLCMVVYR